MSRQATAYHPAQQQPTPDRYREIQQALADRGYFAGPVDGDWAASSTDALKRFQHDQNLPEDGKVGSLSLIALGLGPKREEPANVKSNDAKSVAPAGASPAVVEPDESGSSASPTPASPASSSPAPSSSSAAPPLNSQPVPEAAPQ